MAAPEKKKRLTKETDKFINKLLNNSPNFLKEAERITKV